VNCFTIHPNVYTAGAHNGLVRLLEQVWVQGPRPGDGTFFIVSGFANYNGSVRFLETFRRHVQAGGRIVAVFAGSTGMNLTSRQVVTALLENGSEVFVVNRKRILHAKMYGASTQNGDDLVVTSGNFTGPGMALNVEASVWMGPPSTLGAGFRWDDAIQALLGQPWDIYQPSLNDQTAPAWRLLYDEFGAEIRLDESEQSTLIVTLGHSDTARIQAAPGAKAGRGTQYFWLSRDSYGFFPPLTIRNTRGVKTTFSTTVNIRFVDLGVEQSCRVTFEAENNLDFRLGTAPLRYTRLASQGDLAVISRIGEREYELRIIRPDMPMYAELRAYAVNEIGHEGKRYGYIENVDLEQLLGIQLPRTLQPRTH